MKIEDFNFDRMGILSKMAEELQEVKDDALVLNLGKGLELTYQVLKLKKELIGYRIDEHNYNRGDNRTIGMYQRY